MEVTVKVDLSAVGRFAKTLEKAEATALRANVRKAVKTGGEKVLRQAKSNARWSTGHTSTPKNKHSSIPSAISIRTSFAARSAGVTMKTDASKAPHAFLYERGSTGSAGKFIRHPVGWKKPADKADWHWANNRTRPFFYKAVWGERVELSNSLREAVKAAFHGLGYTL